MGLALTFSFGEEDRNTKHCSLDKKQSMERVKENIVSVAHRKHCGSVIKMTTKEIIEDQSESLPWKDEAPIKK